MYFFVQNLLLNYLSLTPLLLCDTCLFLYEFSLQIKCNILSLLEKPLLEYTTWKQKHKELEHLKI